MKESIDLYKLFIIIPTFLIISLFSFFIIGLSSVEAREDYSVSACWFGSEKKACNTGFDISNMQGKSVAIDINKVSSGTLSFHASLTMNLWNWQSGDTVNVSGAYSFGNASYTCDSSNGCFMKCPTNGNWVNCEMWIDTFHPNNDEKITAVFYLNGNTFNRTFLANATGSAWVDSSTGNLTNGGFNSAMNNQTNSIIGNQDKNKDEIIENQNKNQQQTNEKLEQVNDTNKSILDTIKGVFTAIIELPKKLVELLIEGLKSLFIPSEDDLNDIIDKSSQISENFGFVGESFNFIIRLFTSISGMVNGDGCLMLPSLELKFGGILGLEDYTMWQEQNVCMVDNPWFGRDSEAIDIVRSLLTGTLVCAYIGFAMSQLNSILSKEDTDV